MERPVSRNDYGARGAAVLGLGREYDVVCGQDVLFLVPLFLASGHITETAIRPADEIRLEGTAAHCVGLHRRDVPSGVFLSTDEVADETDMASTTTTKRLNLYEWFKTITFYEILVGMMATLSHLLNY